MKRMKKIATTLLCFGVAISTLCACSSTGNGGEQPAEETTTKQTEVVTEATETTTEETTTTAEETTETPTNQGNTAYTAVDPAPYWKDDDYFDMIGYLEACGCKVMYKAVIDGDFHTSDAHSSETVAYSVFFEESALHPNDSSASLVLYFTSREYGGNTLTDPCVNSLAISYYDNNNRYHDAFTPLPIIENKKDIIVDQYHNTLDIHTITQIEMLINKIYATQFHGETFEIMNTFFDDYNQY